MECELNFCTLWNCSPSQSSYHDTSAVSSATITCGSMKSSEYLLFSSFYSPMQGPTTQLLLLFEISKRFSTIWQYYAAVKWNVTNELCEIFCLQFYYVWSHSKIKLDIFYSNLKCSENLKLKSRRLREACSNMTLVHRALFTWFIILVFCICLCLRLESRTHWNYFIVFIPLWIFDAILLIYVIIKIITKWRFLERLKELLISYEW